MVSSQVPVYIQDINTLYSKQSSKLIVNNLNAVNNEIFNCLTTLYGELPFEPTFGSKLPFLLYEPVCDFTAWKIQNAAYDALYKWIPYIQLNKRQSSVVPLPSGEGYTVVTAYTIISLDISGQNKMTILAGRTQSNT